MKVIGISGSLREKGNTELLVKHVLDMLSREGIGGEFISLRGKTILPCRGCYDCFEKEGCAQEGDDFAPIYAKMREADGIIVGSPVYFGSAVPQLMALLHRAGFSARGAGRAFSGKVGAPITVARRAGHNFAFAQLLLWFFINDMVIPGSTYWNVAVAGAKGARDAANDKEGLDSLTHFARNMARVMKALAGQGG